MYTWNSGQKKTLVGLTDFRILTEILLRDIFKHWNEQFSITSLLPYITIKVSKKKTWKTPNLNENVEQQEFIAPGKATLEYIFIY